MSNNDTKTNLKPHHGQHSDKQTGKRSLLLRFTIFMAWVAGIGLLLSLVACTRANSKPIATNTNNSYYKDLSKITSDLPSRASLAFFVPDTCLASQAKRDNSTALTYLPAYCKHGGNTVYDGLTLQNKRALGRICKAASSDAESKTRHLLNLSKPDIQSVTLTQKSLGAIHHG